MQKIYLFLILLITPFLATSQNTRYLDEVFTDVDVQSGVTYGVNATVLYYELFNQAVPEALKMDVYTPSGDTETNRPLVLFFHTGSFLPFRNPANPSELGFNGSCGGERSDSSAVEICTRLAKMGYVAASVSYRLGWNPIAITETERRFGIINAAYRGVQDVRTAIRYFRASMDDPTTPNPYGIDPEKIVLFGQGTGGYLSMNTGILDNYLKIPLATNGKFVYDHDADPGTPPIPMIIEGINGDINGETVGINPADGDTLCYPNHVGYPSDFSMSINLGGAIADSAWIDPGQPPVLSFQVPNDPFAPYGESIVNVPGTNLQVILAQGSYIMQKLNEEFGNNAPIIDPGIEFDLSAEQAAAFANSPTEYQEPYAGLYPLIIPADPDNPAEPITSAPWEWSSIAMTPQGDDCNTDMAASMIYIDTIMRFYAPRACFVLGLDDCIADITDLDIIPQEQVGLNAYPNPASAQVWLESADGQLIRQVHLYDEMGRLIRHLPGVNSSVTSLERQNLPSGRYIALVQFDQGTVVHKVTFQ